MPIIKITSDHENGHTTGGVNGRQFRIPHNVETKVTDEQLEAIQNAHQPRVTVSVIKAKDAQTDAPDAEIVGGVEGMLGGAPESRADPATPASTSGGDAGGSLSAGASPEVTTEGLASGGEGAENLTKTDPAAAAAEATAKAGGSSGSAPAKPKPAAKAKARAAKK